MNKAIKLLDFYRLLACAAGEQINAHCAPEIAKCATPIHRDRVARFCWTTESSHKLREALKVLMTIRNYTDSNQA